MQSCDLDSYAAHDDIEVKRNDHPGTGGETGLLWALTTAWATFTFVPVAILWLVALS